MSSDSSDSLPPISFVPYSSEHQLPLLQRLIEKDLSEPYSVFTYRYFVNNWPSLTLLALTEEGKNCVGCIICKLAVDRHGLNRGYIGMLAVDSQWRCHGLGSSLVERAIAELQRQGADLCVLETEVTNEGAIRLYERLNFVRDTRLQKYYLNGNDAFRLKLFFTHRDDQLRKIHGITGNSEEILAQPIEAVPSQQEKSQEIVKENKKSGNQKKGKK